MKKNIIFFALLTALLIISCADGNNDEGNPALTGTVTINGTAEVGQTLTAVTTALGGSGEITYKWTYGESVTPIGTNATYAVTFDDAGKTIKVTVTRVGYSGEITSAATAVVQIPTLTGTVSISGTATVGQILTAYTGNLQGTGAISYIWKRGDTAEAAGTAISGATSETYIPVADDIGKYITVAVTRAGYSATITSNPTDTVIPDYSGLTVYAKLIGNKYRYDTGLNGNMIEFTETTIRIYSRPHFYPTEFDEYPAYTTIEYRSYGFSAKTLVLTYYDDSFFNKTEKTAEIRFEQTHFSGPGGSVTDNDFLLDEDGNLEVQWEPGSYGSSLYVKQ